MIENDANAAAWGEFRFGAAAGVDDVVMVTVGTGPPGLGTMLTLTTPSGRTISLIHMSRVPRSASLSR